MHLLSRLSPGARTTLLRGHARTVRLVLFTVAAAAIVAVTTGGAASAPTSALSLAPAAKSPPQPVGDRGAGGSTRMPQPAGADTYAPTYSTYRGEDAVGRYYSVTSGPIFDGRCTYGDLSWGPDLSIPIDLGDDLSAHVDANGHPAPGNPL